MEKAMLGGPRLPLSSGQFVIFFAAEALGVDEGSVADLLVPIRQESSISGGDQSSSGAVYLCDLIASHAVALASITRKVTY
jgi:hypothetical protein